MRRPGEKEILRTKRMAQRDTLLSHDLPNIIIKTKMVSRLLRNMTPCMVVRKFHTLHWKSFEEITSE